ncbi:hypothetical protein bcgnr5383_00220 [Bacillus cereus]
MLSSYFIVKKSQDRIRIHNKRSLYNPILFIKAKQKEGVFVPPSFSHISLIKGSFKIGRPIPFTLYTDRAFERYSIIGTKY